MRFLASLALLTMIAASPLPAKGLTVEMGETWIFRLDRGQPAHIRKAAPSTAPRPGEIRVTVRAMLGTTMTLVSNSPKSYSYRATLIGADGKKIAARSCALPSDNRLSFESWPQKASAVRIGDFKPAASDQSCP